MKKVISTGLILMTVLMGCSVSKPTKNAVTNQKKQDIAITVLEAAPEELKKELDKLTPAELNALTSKGETLYDIALARGSIDTILVLFEKGVSPFRPNAAGLSLYTKLITKSPFDALETPSLIGKVTGKSASTVTNILDSDDWSSIPERIENFEIPCDDVVKRILIRKDRKISLPALINKAPSCKYSLQEKTLRLPLEKLMKKMFASDFANFSDLQSLYPLLPRSLHYTQINDYNGGIYSIHTEIMIKIFRNLNPVKADELLQTIEGHKKGDEAAIAFSWLKDPKDKRTLSTKTIQQFNESLDSETSTSINKLIMDRFAPEDES